MTGLGAAWVTVFKKWKTGVYTHRVRSFTPSQPARGRRFTRVLPGAEDIVHKKVDYARIRKEEIDSRIVLPLVLYAVPKYHKFICENFIQF